MGLLVSVYKNGRDSTAGGDSSKAVEICVINVPGPFEPDDHTPAFALVPNALNSVVLKPVHEPDNMMGPCFGGNYAATSDSRFDEAIEEMLGHRFYGAIPIHDRFDSWEAYDYLSR